MTQPTYQQIPTLDVFAPGRDITGLATTPVMTYTFLSIAGPRDTATGAPTVTTATAGGTTCGVCKYAVNAGQLTGIARGNSRVVWVLADAPITPGQQVQVGANGTAVPLATGGTAVGYSIDTVATGFLAPISLY